MILEDLLTASESKIQGIARKMAYTYRLSREDQEDLCSAMRLRLFTNYQKVDFSRPEAGAYVHGMLINAARTYLMTKILKHKDHVVSLDVTHTLEDGSEGESFASLIPDPRSLSEDKISFRAVYKSVLATLPPRHRKMVQMHMAGITNQEIADRVFHKNGRPYTAEYVAYLLSTFRNELRRRIKPTLKEPAMKEVRKRPPIRDAKTGIRLAIIKHFINTDNKPATHAEIAAALNLRHDYVKSNINLMPPVGLLEVVEFTKGRGPRRCIYRLKDGWQERISKKIRFALENTLSADRVLPAEKAA